MKEKRNKILKETLKLVAFDGWNNATLRAATKAAGLPEHYEKIAFKNGIVEVISLFNQQLSDEVFAQVNIEELQKLKIRERIFKLLDTRFAVMAKNKAAVRKTVQFMAMPQNNYAAAKILWSMADAIWYAAFDNAVDFNHYTKRATLIAVYSVTLLFWLNDNSKQQHETSEFLKRRIENIMEFEQLKKKISGFFI